MENKSVTVLTPTFNRATTLPKCYESLLSQSSQDFHWIVVDDGSTDDTKELVERWQRENRIPITYLYQENSGKCAALNLGIEHARGELTLVLDSDDILTEHAIAAVLDHWTEYAAPRLAGLMFLKGYISTGKPIGDVFPNDHEEMSTIKMRHVYRLRGDKEEVFRTDLLKSHPNPVFEGEKYLPLEIVWNRIARRYPMIHINEIIYLAEYLEGGLTSTVQQNRLQMRLRNPEGFILCDNEKLSAPYPWRSRLTAVKHYIALSLWKYSPWQTLCRCENKMLCLLCFPLGIFRHVRDRKKNRQYQNQQTISK